MKYSISILLFVFVIFLSTPTIIMVLEKKADVTFFYDFSEEENQKENKEIKDLKTVFTLKNQLELIAYISTSSQKKSIAICSKHINIAEEIFIPPPELV